MDFSDNIGQKTITSNCKALYFNACKLIAECRVLNRDTRIGSVTLISIHAYAMLK
jgi:hypothetical protein